MSEWKKLAVFVGVFAACWFLPVDDPRFRGAVLEAFALVRWYAREHVLLCLVPAFFIAGAISVFLSGNAVMRYLGPTASRWVSYPVAAASGTILAVCSCTVLPLFASIHKRGAGLGPATAFLYSGPAINVLAIILTARVLGFELGVARAVGAVSFAVIIGLSMAALFPGDRRAGARAEAGGFAEPAAPSGDRQPWQEALILLALLGILVFANWGAPGEGDAGPWALIHRYRFGIAGVFGVGLLLALRAWTDSDDREEWVDASWDFARQILPLLFAGVFVAGFLLGRPGGGEGVVPAAWVARLVGGNSLGANLFASVVGALMYFATLTEVPILDGLLHAGMGQGPALALLLAGPALSLPNMLVIRSVLGTRRTLAFVGLVVGWSTLAGLLYGALFPGGAA